MNFYTFQLERFYIDNTRARHTDSDQVVFGLRIGGFGFPPQTFNAGDVNNGDHEIGLTFGQVWISSQTKPIVVSYEIYNGDRASRDLESVNEVVLDKTIELFQNSMGGAPGLWSLSASNVGGDVPQQITADDDKARYSSETSVPDWSNSFFEVAYEGIANFISPNCDGYVAADAIAQTGPNWDLLIDKADNRKLEFTLSYPGTESPDGCGSDSRYSVTCSITREKVQGSLRSFPVQHSRRLGPGIRSLGQTASTR
jgi:hypothetical protein